MGESDAIRIEVAAAKALAEWKAILAQEIYDRAQELAVQAGQSVVTISHFRDAVPAALQALASVIESEVEGHGNKMMRIARR